MTKIPLASFLNATVGLDTTALEALGFELEDSPNLEGAQVVVNNISLLPIQWVAVAFMTMALLVACAVECRMVPQRHELHWVWTVGLVSSWAHNVDNILRPGTYFTPAWIVTPLFAFPMDRGFSFWLAVLGLGVVSLHTTRSLPIILHSIGTSLGIMHYMAQVPDRFSLWAHASILWEVIMGLVVGAALLVNNNNKNNNKNKNKNKNNTPLSRDEYTTLHAPSSTRASSDAKNRYTDAPRQEDQLVGDSLELPERSGLRQRSRSPKVWS
jgi:hypothetical protein